MKIAALVLVLTALLACNSSPPAPAGAGSAHARSTRATPVCATQDCATGKILDDGCASDGRCASCVNPCPK